MSIDILIDQLRTLDVRLWVEDDRLRFRAPQGVLTEDLRDALKAHKEGILGFLRQAQGARDGALPPIGRAARIGELPLSFSQERLWFLEQWRADGVAAYNLIDAVRLTGRLEVRVLARCLREIAWRHEVLRTTYASRDGRPVQVVAPAADLPLAEVDLRALPAGAREAAARAALAELARLPFDLAAGPVVRAALLCLEDGEHRLLLGFHHIASDGWSSGVMIRELSRLYAVWTADPGAPSPLPPLPLQYADYAVWQRQWLEGPGFAPQLAFWKERLAGAEGVLELPMDRPRPPAQSFRGAARRFLLPDPLCAALDRRSEGGTTRFMALLAGFAALLHRITGAGDLLIGTPVANRRRPEVEPLIGFFVNTLVLRSQAAGDPTAEAFLDHTRDGVLEAFARQDVPFEKLVEELRPERDPSRSPLFQVVFILQNTPAPPLCAPGLVLEPEILENDTAKFDLSLAVMDGAPPLAASLEYSSDLFDATTAERLAAGFVRLAEDLLLHPEKRLSALALLSAAERHQVLEEWSDTGRPCPQVPMVHELFAEHARRDPRATAIADASGRRLTYGELEARANRLAWHLRGLGVGPDVLVAVATGRTLERPVGLLGVLKAGGAYVTLDPDYPPERLAFLLDDSRAPVLLTDERSASVLPETAARVLRLDADWESIQGDERTAPPPPDTGVAPDNLSYVVYTSGSTGKPKGVEIPHAGLMNLVRWHQRLYDVRPGDRGTQIASPAFDASIWELWPYLTAGASLFIPDEETRLSSPGMIRWWAEQGITLAYLMTPLAEGVLEETVPPDVELQVRALIIGGDRLHRGPDPEDPGVTYRLMNHYGPAEYSVTCTVVEVPPRGRETGLPTIGRAIDNTRIYLLDRGGQPVPVGAPGELYVAGIGLARGYHNRPELTAEKFVPDPFAAASGEPGARMYRTGDLVRWLHDSDLDFLGRLDHQVKIRGFRIELGEIEAVLADHPAVQECAVLVHEDEPGMRRLVGYVVLHPTDRTDPFDFKSYLGERLPAYMVPTAFVTLEALPLTANGKVDRRALAEIRAEAGTGLAAPRTPTEEVAAGVWSEVLGLETVGIQDNFFDLGGHSLLAVRIVARIEQALGVAVPLRHLFEAPTVAGLAERIDRLLATGSAAALPPVVPVPHDRPLPLSYSQERLWLHEQLLPGSAAYTTSRAGHLRGPLDLAALAATFDEILRRHEALRTGYHAGPEGHPVQIIEPWRPMALPRIDLRGLPADRREGEAVRLGNEEAARPMPLDRPPLVRAKVLFLAPDEHVVLLSIHHICWDLASGGVLLKELGALYPAFMERRPSPLPELPLQYADFAVWQRGWLAGEVLEGQIAWWRERLAGVESSPLVLPSDRPRPAVETWRGAAHGFLIPHRLADPVRQLGRAQGATVFMTHLALFQALLARSAPQPDLVMGTAISNRSGPELEGVIGFFDNLLPLRTATADAGELGFPAFLARVREVALGLYAHQHLPFELLVHELRLERKQGRTPLLQVIFLFQLDYPAMARELAGLTMSPYRLRVETSRFDLTFALREGPDGVVGQIDYNTDLFDDTTIRRLVRHYEILAEAVLAAPGPPGGRLGELPLLSAAERHQVLEEWSDTGRPCPQLPMVHELFAEHARRDPRATAIADASGRRLTYGELEARANRLAWHLRGLGVGPDVLVAVATGRTLERPVGILGVLKAGGAYVTLDPGYPPERLAFLLDDSRAPVLLTDERSASVLPETAARVLRLDADWESIQGDERTAPLPPDTGVAPDNLSYVVYTSGSTGKPKGVEIPHAGLMNLVRWHQRLYDVRPGDRGTQIASPAFDASIWELWPYLTAGASLFIPDEETRLSSPGMIRWWAEQGITLAYLMTPLAEGVLEETVPPDVELQVRALIIGGDRLHRGPDPEDPGVTYRLMNHYGPAEYSVTCTVVEVPPRGRETGLPTIGRAIDNTRIYLLDRGGQPVPVKVPGELYVAGIGLARGYHNRPELTAEKFVPDPFAAASGEPGARMYRTGDLVRWLPDGDMDFLGRLDHQVKIRGFRIELGEIEAVLAACPGVEAAAVLAPQSANGSRRLVAYVVGEADAADLRERLAERLPEYMVPSVYISLPELPLTANGKVDRRALPEPAMEEGEDVFVAPSDPVEELLAGLWAELLGRGRVGVHDDFFVLGGHSLLATQVVSRLRDLLGVELPLRMLFEEPTVAGLARVVRAAQGASAPLPPSLVRLPLPPAERRSGLPLSFAQQRLWLLDQIAPGSPTYNIPAAVRLSGQVAPEQLAWIFAEVVRRHEALRTTFTVREGRPVQVIAEELVPRLPLLDLSDLPAETREAQARELAVQEAARPFDLERGPLLRLFLVRLADREHLLLMTLHHIVSDGWSMGVLLREVGALWEALATGRPAGLPELPVQYADFAAWQRSWLQGEVLEAQLGVWRSQLAGAPRALELPTDRPRPAVQTFRGALQPVSLPPPLTAAVQEICRRESATPFMVLLAAWAVLLGRHSGQEDLLLGTPIAGRNRREIEGLIGFFINTLVLRVVLRDGPSFAELLSRVRQTSLDAYAHQDVPFERLVEELVPERDLSMSPLFQVAFTLQNAPMGALALPGLAICPVVVESRVARFDLSLSLGEAAAGVFAGALEHHVDLFDGSTAARLLTHFEVLLQAAVRDPEQPLSTLPLLSPAERHQALLEWNDSEKPCPQRPMVHELFALHARRRPEAVAVDGVEGRLTYGELEARSNRLAHHLRRLGVGPEVLVALCTERTPERVTGIVAVLKAGGAYVSLDPAYPRDRLAFLLGDARAPVLLTQSRFLDALPESNARVICLDTDGPQIQGHEDRAPEIGVTPDNLAYVVYTSGSTGKPKGVEIPHAGLMNLVRWHQDLYQVKPEDRATQIASPAFDASIWELWPYLAAGASVHIPDEETRLSSRGMVRWWSEQGITLAYLMTPLAEGVLEEKIPADSKLNVRALIIGGDRLHRGPDPEDPGVTYRLMNHYGPAEYSVTCTVVEVPPRGDETGLPTIGRTIDNTRIYLLDRRGEPVPVGVPGELYVAGIGLARGYHNRPELTAEKFVPNPFSAEPGARMYRTGDLVRWLPEGDMDFLGRLDHQVKIRGFRIELGEIEAVLASHPAVQECAVLAREDRPGDRQLAAYVVLHPTDRTDPSDFKSYLGERLPAYMVPTAFVTLEALPLTPNGKVDRRALPEPAMEEGEDVFVAPSDPVEELLAGLWAELLGRGRVGVHDDFFVLGGHSLLATQVVSRVRDLLGVELPLRTLFEEPTVAGLARVVRAAQGPSLALPPLVRLPLPPEERRSGLPLSFAQQRLWFLDQLEPDSPAYNIPAAVRLSGEIVVERLAWIFTEVVRRHEALRTTFAAQEGRPMQMIAAELMLELPLLDLSDLPAETREAQARDLAGVAAARPFDLEHGPLLRLLLVRLDPREHLLLMTMHHIVSDGWSMGVLLREVGALWEALATGRPAVLPELPVQYADFAVWQRSWLQGEALEAELAHWRDRLAGAPRVLDLPTDRPRPALQTFRGAAQPVSLPPPLSAAVSEICRRQSMTPFMVLLAAWAALLGRHAGQEDVLVGAPIAGRNRREIEGLIGFFVNTLVLRADLQNGPSFREVLGRVRFAALDAYAHQDVPFERLVEELVPERDLSRSPLFQVLFAVQNAPATALNVPGLTLAPVPVENGLAKFDLTLAFWEGPSGWSGALEYNTDLFDGTTAERFLRHFASLLASAAEDPGRPLSELRLMDAAEERLLTTDLNRTERVWATPVAVHDLFARQAGRTPDKIAAAGPPGALTYREIAERSAALAALIGPGALDRRIALLADPDPQILVGMLGIFEAGCGFVPLDPRHPDDRLAWMLEDCGCEVLVTQRPHLERAAGLAAGLRLLCLEDVPSGVPSGARPDRDPRELRSLAYVVYTSGSTGRPKGVQVSHESLVPMLLWGCGYLGLGAHTRVLQNLSFCFDFGIFEHLTTVVAGGALHYPGGAAGDPEAFAREIVRHGIDTLHTTPVFARELPAAGESLDSLRIVHLGGEALSPSTVERVRKTAPRATVYNGYGPTEATINSSIFRIRGCIGDDVGPVVPIGRRSADNALYVLDPASRLSPYGARGELHVGGIGVARGYLNRPELTAERFVPDPFGAAPGGRLYKTGDLVRYLPAGDIEFLGRIDHQVKVRGFRIELGEVEAALRAHPEVRDCVVVARDEVLVAYTVGGPDAADLRSFLGERLPVYMVPSAFVDLPALPLSPNGKVDRKALPAPRRSQAPEAAPSDPIEALLAGIWAEVLGDRGGHIGRHESFFTLGGHSLLATQVMSRVRDLLGVELPLRALFEEPTVAGLAQVVRVAQGPSLASPPLVRLPLPPEERRSGLPLSFAQQRLWFLDQLDPDSPAYNIPAAVRLQGEVAVERLAWIFAEVVRRHEALRTTFAAQEGRPLQVIAAELAPELPLLDLSGLPAREREAQARDLAGAEAARPFDLEHGPLLRLLLVRLDPREHLLLMTMHHIVSDGWSMGVLLREIGALWEALATGRPAVLPELPVQYADFAVWQRSWLQGEALEAELAHWRDRLAGAPRVLDLPTDRPRPAMQTFRGAAQPVSLPPPLSSAVSEICRRQSLTPFMALLAAWAALLGRHAVQEDVLVGAPIAGRNRREIEGLIGFFVNTLVLRADLRNGPSFRELLDRIRSAALDAYAHQDAPFERLVEELVPERDPARPPLFQVLFVLQNAPLGELALPGLSLTPLSFDSGVAKFDLSLALGEGSDGFSGTLEYNTDLFDGTTAERLWARFLVLVEGAVARPGTPLPDLPLLPPGELEQVLSAHNATATEYPREASLPELFAAVARELPEAPAIVAGEEIWTYRRLDEAADRLARHLRALGVGFETPVGIALERSPELIVGTLAIVKAGGVYVPLDAAYPDERLAFMLEDTGAEVVLVHEPTRERMQPLARTLVDLNDPYDEQPSFESFRSFTSFPSLGGDALAYVIYTSGSTGRPKGVAVTHRAIVRLVRETNYVHLGPGDRTGQVANSSFDAATYEIWGALLTGAAVVVIPRDVVLSPSDFAEALRRQRVTSMFLTSALFTRMAREVPEAFAEMSELLVGGEAVDPVAARTVLAGRPPRRLLNGYGPTESTTFAAWHPIRELPEGAATVPIGLPLANTKLYVLDRWQSPVPPGSVGELCIGGDGLARGYLNRPELTGEKFVPHPWSVGERLYRTGDLVRQRLGEPIEYLGRIDHQVKIRGFRIELGEIEAVLAGHPEVREAAVLARGEGGEARLVAYAAGRAGGAPRAEDLRDWLQQRLPEYMIPAVFVVLDALPLDPNGKVDRKALPAPERGLGGAESGGPGPRDWLELELARLWEELLGVGPIGVHDDFFALGGHSLLAVQLAALLRSRLGRTVSMATLLRHTTIEGLAAVLRRDAGMPLRGSPLVELAPGSGQPLFLMHPIGGEVLSYVHLARRLAGRSVWGVQVPEIPDDAVPETLEERAAGYLRALREVQPAGPYLLGGWSLGGVLAFEMARQLESGGEAVEAVLLIDSHAPGSPGAAGTEGRLPDAELAAAFAFDLARVAGVDNLAGLELDRSDFARLAEQAERAGLLPPGLDAAELERRFSRWAGLLRALERYAGGPCAARLLLLKAAERAAGMVLPEDLGWGRLAGPPVEVHELAGDHYTLLREPGVERLAALVRERLFTLPAAP